MFVDYTSLTLAIVLSLPFCQAAEFFRRKEYDFTSSKALRELRDVIVNPRNTYTGELVPRLHFPAKPLLPHASSPQDSAAAVKRTLLGIRQNCGAGFGYCYSSGKCCPDSDGKGGCCNDGSCVTSSQTCCLYGGSCTNDLKCCQKGCAPKNTDCCGDNHHCDEGYFCCGNGHCAPNGGECCYDGSVCPNGKKCVVFDGKQTCCKDLTCAEYRSGGGGGGSSDTNNNNGGGGGGGNTAAPAPAAPTAPSISIPSITVPSFTPPDVSFPTPTIPSLPAIPTTGTSFSFPTLTAATTPGGGALSTFSTTLTLYYYTIFITTTTFLETESAFLSTAYTFTERVATAVATDSLDANLLFDDVVLSWDERATQRVSALGVSDFSATRTTGGATGPVEVQATAGTGAGVQGVGGSGGAASMAAGRCGVGVWVWGVMATGIGVGMVLL
ncbi:MAG: hypothetical protein Q9220_001944 [cf. Caloplaca sp. 1 TL-2023]